MWSAGQRNERRIRPRLRRNVRDRSLLSGVETGQKIRQIDAIGRQTTGAVDPQAKEICSLVVDLILDQRLHLLSKLRGNRPFDINPHRPPIAVERGILLDRLARQSQHFRDFGAILRQTFDESQLPSRRAREQPRLAGGLDHLGLLE